MATFGEGVLISADDGVRIRVDASLSHLGHTELEIAGLAIAERHHFVQAREGLVRRMLVVQLERFLPSNHETYRYVLPDPVEMGGASWGRWVYCYSLARAEAPEDGDTVRLLRRHELALEDEQIMARYARIVGDDARREILIFYHEPLRALGHSLATLAATDGTVRPTFESVARDLQARARRAFEVE